MVEQEGVPNNQVREVIESLGYNSDSLLEVMCRLSQLEGAVFSEISAEDGGRPRCKIN